MKSAGLLGLGLVCVCIVTACTSRPEGTCERDSHCEGAKVCFEGRCVTVAEKKAIEEKRKAESRPKVCKDEDGDGVRAGNGCPKGETLDCDDSNPQVAPGRNEVCDDFDNNCDGRNNEGLKGCVGTILGGASWGTQQGIKVEAPRSVVYSPEGFIVVSDNHHLWKVRLDSGRVQLLAGSHISNYADGKGDEARFSYPAGLAMAPNGTIYVADCKNNCVRKVAPDGTVSRVAGFCSNLTKYAGQFADGPAADARFYCPADVTIAPDGALIVVDRENARIRRISTDGQVTTIAGAGPVEVEEGEGQIGFKDGPAAEARFNDPQAALVDSKGIVYVSESFNCRIRRIDPAKGMVSTLAGESDTKLGVGGYADGLGRSAKFSYPHGMAFDDRGNMIVADTGNAVIRIVTRSGRVRTMYGKPGESKAVDGPIRSARFQTPTDVAPGPGGSLFVVDTSANRVRWIVP
ncbi:MAG: hypothetical protein D6806_05070 [Deltaproteobacteria bacterium]|nr:MAG: hypothetical protein D6806_05070 [Deltaproteobacteria bacterium]